MALYRYAGATANVTVEAVEELEQQLVQFCREVLVRVDSSFPSHGERGAIEKGQVSEYTQQVLFTRCQELRDGRGLEIMRLLRAEDASGAVRVKAVGLAEGNSFEASWSFVVDPDRVEGDHLELVVAGEIEEKIVGAFSLRFGSWNVKDPS